MKHVNILTLGLMFLLTQSLFSQTNFHPALLVNNQNDTIYGTGNISINHEYCLFKRFDANEYTKYYPNEISAFRIIGGKYYVSRNIKESDEGYKWYFLEFLVDGEIDLFTITKSNRFFMGKEGEDLIELNDNYEQEVLVNGREYIRKNRRYLGYLKFYMEETPELFPKIDKMSRLKQRDLVNLSVEYHNAICSDYDCVDYTKNVPKTTYKFELITGVSRHNSYYSPQIGLLIHIWRPLKNEKLFLKTGILYTDRPFRSKSRHGPFEEPDPEKIDNYDYAISFPFSFQYVFGRKEFKPTIAIGWPTGFLRFSSVQGGFIYSFSEKFELSISGSIDGLMALPFNSHQDFFNNPLGHSLNFGLIYNLQ